MNPVLDNNLRCDDDGLFRIGLYHRIYHRKNETLSRSKSFFDVCCRHWVTMLFSFEIALKSFVLPRQLWSSLKFMSKNQRNISNFRLFTHVMCWIELCQYHFWDFWKKIITFKKKSVYLLYDGIKTLNFQDIRL